MPETLNGIIDRSLASTYAERMPCAVCGRPYLRARTDVDFDNHGDEKLLELDPDHVCKVGDHRGIDA